MGEKREEATNSTLSLRIGLTAGPKKYTNISLTYTLGEAGEQDAQPEWVSQAVAGLLGLHSEGAVPNCAAPFPEGTPEIRERLDSHGSPGPGPTLWPGPAWSYSSETITSCVTTIAF